MNKQLCIRSSFYCSFLLSYLGYLTSFAQTLKGRVVDEATMHRWITWATTFKMAWGSLGAHRL